MTISSPCGTAAVQAAPNILCACTSARLQYRGCVKVKDGLLYTYGDRQRWLEVIQNLLDHAAKFMGKQVKPCIEVGISG